MRWRWMTGLGCTTLLLVACPQPSDTTPPTIASSSPASGASGVAVTTNLAVTFSEPMSQASVTVSISPGLNLGSPVWNTASTVAFDPPDLALGTSYTIQVEGKDMAGNALSGSKTITFQTVLPPDTTPPSTPTGLSAAALDGGFKLDWAANPESDLAGYTVLVGTDAGTLLPTLFIEKPATTASVTGLENGKPYFFALEAQDASGNRSNRTSTGSITPKDAVAPSLVSSEPANGTTDLSLVPALRFTFSEPMDKTSLEIGMCVSTDPPVSATCANPSLANFGTPTWSENDTVAQFTVTNQLQGGKTHVLVLFAKDKSGNLLGTPNNKVAFSVRATPDTTPPAVTATNAGANAQTHTGFVELSFSEAMNQQSVQNAFLSQPAITCAWVWTGNTARCNAAMTQFTAYTFTLSTGAKDSAGNALAAPSQFTFMTLNFNPRLLSTVPRNGAARILPAAPITFTFSEPMNQTSVQNALEVKVGSTVKTGTLEWNAEGTVVKFTPSSSYGFGAVVTWRITTAAREAFPVSRSSLGLPTEVSGSFSTLMVIGP